MAAPPGFSEAQWLEKVRVFIGDSPIYNRLVEGYELTDGSLKLAIDMTIDEYNVTPPEIATVTYETYPSLKGMLYGAALHCLVMAGLIQARNFIQFQDGRLGVVLSDKSPAYQSWLANLAGQYSQIMNEVKYAKNTADAFGYIPSPYDFVGWDIG